MSAWPALDILDIRPSRSLPPEEIPEGSWLARLLARKPRMLVAIALASKMARQIWAMLAKEQDYREPAEGCMRRKAPRSR
jgi:hypothetical protein